MRIYLISAAAIGLLAGCGGGGPQQRSEDLKSYDVREEAPAAPSTVAPGQAGGSRAGPDVAPTAAPGVAFNYRYAFRLPAQRVAQVQEHHARTCEQLGPDRCRITGMRYRVVNERDIEGHLAFQLEPGIARRFGRAGVEAVTRSEGMLIESEITGHDAGRNIRAAGRSIAQMGEDLRRIEQRLAQRGLSAEERQQLQYEAEELRRSIRAAGQTREEERQSLAATPVVFNYASGELGENFDQRPSIARAAERAGDNFVHGLTIMMILAVTLAPWLLLALLLWLGWRRLGRRLTATPEAAPEEVRPTE